MAFWGFDRSRRSLRLEALSGILYAPRNDNIQKLVKAIPSSLTANPLSPQEIEVLIGLSRGVFRNPVMVNPELFNTLENVFYATPELVLETPSCFSPAAASAHFNNLGPCFSREIATNLSGYFLKAQRPDIVSKALSRFDSSWSNPAKNSSPVLLFGSLLGTLEGVCATKTPMDLEFVERIHKYCDSDFLTDASARLSHHSSVTVAQLWPDIANITELLISSATDPELERLVRISTEQIDKLERSHHFYSVHSEEVTLVETTLLAYMKVVQAAFRKELIALDPVLSLVMRIMTDPSLVHPDLVALVGEMAAEVISDKDQLFFSILEPLSGFLAVLTPEVSYHCAARFANVFKKNFKDESSHVKLLYTLSNKLTSEEFNFYNAGNSEHEATLTFSAILSALMAFVVTFNNEELFSLLYSLLDMKYGVINDVVDAQFIETYGLLAQYLSKQKFSELLEQLGQCSKPDSPGISRAIVNAYVSIAKKTTEPQFYLDHLLNLLIIRGDPMYAESAREVFRPLATLVETHPELIPDDASRNAWASLATIGFTIDSLSTSDRVYLSKFAKWSSSLVSEDSVNSIDSDIQLNPVLARGASPEVLKIQKHALSKVLSDVPHSSSMKMMFMASTLLLEGLRGSLAKLPLYFVETDLASGDGYGRMHQLCMWLANDYMRMLGLNTDYKIVDIVKELKELLVLTCYRVGSVRKIATELVTIIVSGIPAALCQSKSLFTLLDCVTLLGESISNAVEDEYSPKAVFTSKVAQIKLELSDNLNDRRRTLQEFEVASKSWLATVSKKLGPELKSRLCTYIGNAHSSGRGRRFALSALSFDDISDDFMSEYLVLTKYHSQTTTAKYDAVLAQLLAASSADQLEKVYIDAAGLIKSTNSETVILIKESVKAAFRIFTKDAIDVGMVFWLHISRHEAGLRPVVINEVCEQCSLSAANFKGIFSRDLDQHSPLWSEMHYEPTHKDVLDKREKEVLEALAPHELILSGFLRSSFYNFFLASPLYVPIFVKLCFKWLNALIEHGSLHSLARNLRLKILQFVEEVARVLRLLQNKWVNLSQIISSMEKLIVSAGLSWYTQATCQWPYGSNSRRESQTLRLISHSIRYFSSVKTPESGLLTEFMNQEFNKLSVWHDPLANNPTKLQSKGFSQQDVELCWAINPVLAVRVATIWQCGVQEKKWVEELVQKNPIKFLGCEEALQLYLNGTRTDHKVIYWTQVSPIESVNLLSPIFKNTAITQLALRSLQLHPITKCFFYVPQIVQQLRHDESGFVEEYILEAAKFSQKFAHQIIWNVMANMYNDDDGTIPNDMKPKLDEILAKMKAQFTDDERSYYDTEFKFFAEVTGISGKLKPFIKEPKPVKKEKIDEELLKVKVPHGVYLPSHPNGTVEDIDRMSGKPLQSHAKAPFMATFKLSLERGAGEIWQSAIFKVGDDCRQDVLALQIISVFRSIFNFCGLDVFVFPYKVTATAAGRGIIDVLPHSISRDMLGREAVNGLDQWFRSKYGGPDSIEFQRARLNFVKSMAAYSVISYLIQFKDRHNGNIMYDADGHIIHIDFGFCFDITPGGVRFEAAPFKLTKEMVQVMGGSSKAMAYKWFEELCVRAFLASRVYADDICRMVEPMLESGLPCFKGHTIKRLRERFALNKNDVEAAHFMRSLIAKSHESNYTKGYDEFQRITNGIPH